MGKLLNKSSVLMCPHGGTVSISTTNTRVKGGGDFLVRRSDIFTIAGCTLTISSAPHPCVTVNWVQFAAKGKTESVENLAEESVGLCAAADQAVQGAVQITTTQAQVSGI